MRPLRVELEGIGSFRDPTVLDLAGVDLFVLSGPTGAGKTTLLVDAMMLALYGTVPRYDDRRLVAPVIHQGSNEGRVRLTFSVAARTFTATRVVRRTRQGATTKEARLEEVTGGGSRVLAGAADEVTDAVASLVGLTFDQFCRSVVLPQGAFDRFLFAKPSERADLLVQLLDLRLHEQIGKRARARATEAAARADAAQRRLDGDLAGADPAQRDALAARVTALEALAERCRDAEIELDELKERGGELRAAADAAAADRDALASLHRPDDVDALAAATRSATDAQRDAAAARADTAQVLDRAEEARTALPDAEALAAVTRTVRDLAAAEDALPERQAAAAVAADDLRRAAGRAERAAAAVAEARTALEAAQHRELVHAVSEGLHAGDDCPVCGTTLADDPAPGAGTATIEARHLLDQAEAAASRATGEHQAADRAAATAAERHQAAIDRRDVADTARTDALARAQVLDAAAATRLLDQIRAADAAVRAARDADRAARGAEADAATAIDRAREREADAWVVHDRARDIVARLGPPTADRTDLAAAWDGLLSWAAATRPVAGARADEAAAAVAALADRYREASGQLRTACLEAGVEVTGGTAPGVAVAGALATARARHATLTERLEQAVAVRAERDHARDEAAVAEHLGKLLRADGFERWLLSRALGRLVGGASSLLRELTSGAYSLALDATNQFLVVDHRSADEPRTVKSLSGGERFLASLALALALADHVAELAADGSARLESLFLDEGFGTLDADTLDVVAAALEELGSRGRVVGIVTHVRDLAERLPVRFEVRRGPSGSSVTRSDADESLAVDAAVSPDAVASGTDPEQLASGTGPEQLASGTDPEQLASGTDPEVAARTDREGVA